MANIPRARVHKIPGTIMPSVKETHVKDLTKLSVVELVEIKEREKKLLSNKARLKNLPDKGKRIQDYYDRIVLELDRRTNIDDTAILFSAINIGVNHRNILNEIEWNGRPIKKPEEGDFNFNEDVCDSDDEIEIDPFRILVQRNTQERQLKTNAPEVTLITEQDLLDIKSFQSKSNDSDFSGNKKEDIKSNSDAITSRVISNMTQPTTSTNLVAIEDHNNKLQNVEAHARYVIEKTELYPTPQREKFKPYKMTLSNVADPDKDRNHKKIEGWEVTAATPPPIQHSGAKMLTLMESVTIQENYLTNLKELYERQAVKRLAAKQNLLRGQESQLNGTKEINTECTFTKYRATANHIEGDEYFNEDEHVNDPLSEEKPGSIITYSLFSN